METPPDLLFYGNHELTFDDRNRILIPGSVRSSLDPERDGTAFFVVDGVNLKLWLYPEKAYRTMVSKLSSEMAPGPDQLEFDHWNFGSAECVEWDKQGRILIAQKMLDTAELKKEVTLVGARNHLELWNRPEWDAYAKEIRKARGEENAKRARKSEVNRIV